MSPVTLPPPEPLIPRFGFRPDPDHRKPPELDRAIFGLRDGDTAPLEEWIVPITRTHKYQRTNCCVGAGISLKLAALCDLANIPCPDLSMAFAYSAGRRIEAGPGVDLTDGGVPPWAVIQAVQGLGICADAAWIDDTATVNQQPSDQAFVDAFGAQVTGISQITSDVQASVLAVLRGNHFIGRGGAVSKAYTLYQGGNDDAWGVPAASDIAGEHWETIYGYRKRASGLYEFAVWGSWGTGWGLDGNAWVTADNLFASFDMRVLQIAPKPPVGR